MVFIARFGHNERVDVPGDRMFSGKPANESPAFLAFIWMVNAKRPGTFAEPKLTVEGEHTVENYPDARVIMGNGSREQRFEEGFRITTTNPELIPLFDETARWIYDHSYAVKPCRKCKTEAGRDGHINYAVKNGNLCILHSMWDEEESI